MSKLVTATVSAALCMMSVAPGVAAAQEYRFTGYDAPRGVTATVNLRVPLGRQQAARPSYGLTLGLGRTVAPDVDGRTHTRALNVADFRFNDSGLSQARVASFDLANFDRDRRMNMMAGGGKKTWLVIGAIVVAGVVICLAADCFDGDDSSSGSTSPGN